jgi:hypothetical protein
VSTLASSSELVLKNDPLETDGMTRTLPGDQIQLLCMH